MRNSWWLGFAIVELPPRTSLSYKDLHVVLKKFTAQKTRARFVHNKVIEAVGQWPWENPNRI
jgi:hypothetical protein